MGGLYPVMAVVVGGLIIADIGILFHALLQVNAKAESKQKQGLVIVYLILVTSIICAIAMGYFAIDVFFLVSGMLTRETRVPDLADLPRMEDHGENTRDDEDGKGAIHLKNIPLGKGGDMIQPKITGDLHLELLKLPFSNDRIALCKRFVRKIPPNTRIPETEVNDILRLFGDTADGLVVLGLFEPYMVAGHKKLKKGKKGKH